MPATLLLYDDPNDDLLRAWGSCAAAGFALWADSEPLDSPRDLMLTRKVVERRGATEAQGDRVEVDLSLVMEGFSFEEVWARRRTFVVDGVDVPIARLNDIVTSKARLGRPKDRLFLATHAEALKELIREDSPPPGS